MTIDLDQLETLATAATPGPWDYGACEVFLKGTDFWPVIATCRNEDDLAFIAAANPAVVLELIAELRAKNNLDEVNEWTEELERNALRNELKRARAERDWLAETLENHGLLLTAFGTDIPRCSEAEWLRRAREAVEREIDHD